MTTSWASNGRIAFPLTALPSGRSRSRLASTRRGPRRGSSVPCLGLSEFADLPQHQERSQVSETAASTRVLASAEKNFLRFYIALIGIYVGSILKSSNSLPIRQ